MCIIWNNVYFNTLLDNWIVLCYLYNIFQSTYTISVQLKALYNYKLNTDKFTMFEHFLFFFFLVEPVIAFAVLKALLKN